MQKLNRLSALAGAASQQAAAAEGQMLGGIGTALGAIGTGIGKWRNKSWWYWKLA